MNRSAIGAWAAALGLLAAAPAVADDPAPQKPVPTPAQGPIVPPAPAPTRPPVLLPGGGRIEVQLPSVDLKIPSTDRLRYPTPPVARGAVRMRPPPIPIAPAKPLAPPEQDFAKADPAVIQGVLPNGLRYAIRQRPSHGRESVQLRILTGSRDESPGELGAAHFVEHMAFNGSRNFPDGGVMQQFEAAGIGAGRDQNALTSYWNTTYLLDLPEADKAKLDLSFQWLRDVANGLNIDRIEVDRERGVVLSEYRLHLGPARDSARAIEYFKLPLLRGPLRVAIGTEASIQALSAADLRRFYRRWYRPDRAILVAVGETPAAEIKARIEAAFGDWRASGAAPDHPSEGVIGQARSADVLTLTQPALSPVVEVCRLSPHDKSGPQSAATRSAELADLEWKFVMDRRLMALGRSDKPPFAAAGTILQNDYNVATEACLVALPRGQDWTGALEALGREARRFETYGPTAAELHDATADLVGGLNHDVATESAAPPTAIAERLLLDLTEGLTIATPEEERRIQFRALAQMTGTAVRDAFHRRWSWASAPLTVVQTPEAVASADVAARSQAAITGPPPSAPVDETHAAWAYASFEPAGQVVERTAIHDPDFVRLKFANGVVVNFKQTNFAKGEILIRIRFGAGDLELPTDLDYAAKMGAGVLLEGGFGKNSAEDLVRTCTGRSCNAALVVDRSHFELNGSAASPLDLDLELQLLTALLSDPGFRPAMDVGIATQAPAGYRQWAMTPSVTASFALTDTTLAPHAFRLPPLAEAMAYNSHDFERVLRPAMTRDALEVTIVGDLDEARAVDALRKTLGALPPREPGDHMRPDAPRVRYPKTAPAPVTVFHDGPKGQATVLTSWPIYVWTPERTREDRALTLLAQVMQDTLIDNLREKLGKTYSPTVGIQSYRGGDDGAFMVSVDTTPEAARTVAAAVRSIAQDFARGGLSAEQLERARKPIVANYAKDRTYNTWWLESLDGTYTYPDRLMQARTWEHDIAEVPLDEVRRAARRWLSPEPILVFALPCPDARPCRRDLEEASGPEPAASGRRLALERGKDLVDAVHRDP